MNNIAINKKGLLIVLAAAAMLFVSYSLISSTTYSQLAISSLLYPPLVYFVYKLFSKGESGQQSERAVLEVRSEGRRKEPVEIVDVDKRAFLKMILSAGFSFFIFSLFTRRVEDLIMSRNAGQQAPNSNDTSVSPTDDYKVTEIVAEDFNYYGFVNKDGNWYIMKEDPTAGSFRYVKGDFDFSSAWAKRKNLKYDYYYKVFK